MRRFISIAAAVRRAERAADEIPCRGCGVRATDTPALRTRSGVEATDAELAELARAAALAVRSCPACGRVRYDLTAVSDADLSRALAILRPLFDTGDFP